MKQITISELRKMLAKEIKTIPPCELTSDGVVIAELNKPGEQFTGTCPGCGRVVTMGRPEDKPYFFSLKQS